MNRIVKIAAGSLIAGALLVGPAQAGGDHDRDRDRRHGREVVTDRGPEFERHKDHGHEWTWEGRKCRKRDHPKPPVTTTTVPVPTTTVPPPTTVPPVEKPEKPQPIHGTATNKSRKPPGGPPIRVEEPKGPRPNYTPPEFNGSTGPTPFAG